MSDAWVNVSALSFPRRHAMARFAEAALFRADVPLAALFPAWIDARNQAVAGEWLEKNAHRLLASIGAPSGATLVAIGYSYTRAMVEIVLSHPSLDVVPEGQQAPVLWESTEHGTSTAL